MISLKLSGQDSSILSSILSKKYNLQYTVKSGNENISAGFVYRNGNYLFARHEQGFSIQEDTLIFSIDTVLQLAMLGPISIVGPFLVNPGYDPFQILEYTKIWKSSFKQTMVNDTIIEIYQFPENVPMHRVEIKSFLKGELYLKLDYQQLNTSRHDVVVYKFIAEDSMIRSLGYWNLLKKLREDAKLKRSGRSGKTIFLFVTRSTKKHKSATQQKHQSYSSAGLPIILLYLQHMEININTPAILFPAISLIMLAYTNRFLALSIRIRNLHERYEKGEKQDILHGQIKNLRYRLNIIKTCRLLV